MWNDIFVGVIPRESIRPSSQRSFRKAIEYVMAWFILLLAGLFEIAWASGMKASEGFTRPGPTVFTLVTLTISMVLLAIAVREIPIGTGYAIWTGVGAAGTMITGILLFGEPATAARISFLVLILIGIVGLKFVSQ
jgi:quaternary ammonium compound-resistance protein SugE